MQRTEEGLTKYWGSRIGDLEFPACRFKRGVTAVVVSDFSISNDAGHVKGLGAVGFMSYPESDENHSE